MKKILITTLLTVSTVAFAKTEEPKTKTDLPKKEEKVLVAKKTIKGEKKIEQPSFVYYWNHPCETWSLVADITIRLELLERCFEINSAKK